MSPVFALVSVLALGNAGPTMPTPAEPRSVWSFAEAEPLIDLEGAQWTRTELEGRWVLLDFWATWCAPCLAEVPNLRDIAETWPDERLLILSASVDRGHRRDLLSWLRRHEITWPQLHDGRGLDGDLARRFAVDAVPRTVLVDPGGRIVAVDLRGEELRRTLEILVPVD